MRFNPPPNWPAAPQGWTPPPGWEPDPSWGPTPPGWTLWVDDAAPPTATLPATESYPPAAESYPPAAQTYEQPYATADQGGYDQTSGYAQGGYDPSGGYQQGGYPQPGYQQGAYPQAPYGGPAARGTSSGGGNRTAILAVAGVLVVALVAVGVVLLVNGNDDETPVATGVSTTAPPTTSEEEEPTSDAPTATSAPRTTTAAPTTAPTPSGETLALGQPGTVGDYAVTITAVNLEGDAAMAEESSSNPPSSEGRYVIVDFTVTNNGTEAQDPFFDLYATFRGTDGSSYADTDCDALTPNDLSLVNEVAPGATASAAYCMDVNPASIPGSTVTFTDGSSDVGPTWPTGG